jgi:hypothetical protein
MPHKIAAAILDFGRRIRFDKIILLQNKSKPKAEKDGKNNQYSLNYRQKTELPVILKNGAILTPIKCTQRFCKVLMNSASVKKWCFLGNLKCSP